MPVFLASISKVHVCYCLSASIEPRLIQELNEFLALINDGVYKPHTGPEGLKGQNWTLAKWIHPAQKGEAGKEDRPTLQIPDKGIREASLRE